MEWLEPSWDRYECHHTHRASWAGGYTTGGSTTTLPAIAILMKILRLGRHCVQKDHFTNTVDGFGAFHRQEHFSPHGIIELKKSHSYRSTFWDIFLQWHRGSWSSRSPFLNFDSQPMLLDHTVYYLLTALAAAGAGMPNLRKRSRPAYGKTSSFGSREFNCTYMNPLLPFALKRTDILPLLELHRIVYPRVPPY